MHRTRQIRTASCIILILLLGGCGPFSSITIGKSSHPAVGTDRSAWQGPPPHAPAHGYRHKQRHQGRDLDLVFDTNLGVYVVVSLPNRYYWNGYYLRIDGSQWYASTNLDSGWELRSDDSLPPGLKKQKKHKKAKSSRSKKSSPAKGHW
ncbi:MAG: hypothetical protein JRH17_23905 [Deltaproteobacteria bacterium]|nr:hypothetical protein [Deltaproteobacteria bacterium]